LASGTAGNAKEPGTLEGWMTQQRDDRLPADPASGSDTGGGWAVDGGPDGDGVAATDLSDDDLLRELGQLHRTRHDTFLHAPTQALQRHSERTAELELEYLRRRPQRDIDEGRLRERSDR
jgi:hypothetical protein